MTIEEMREPTFLLLTALAEGPQHGYALLQAVSALSNGRVHLRPGSLYGALDRLAREGLVRESGTEVVASRHRRYYDLTEVGVRALTTATQRVTENAAAAEAALRRRVSEAPADLSPRGSVGLAGGQA